MGKTREISDKIDNIVSTFDNGEMNIVANTATKLNTPVNIAGVSFDGSTNINIPFNNLSSKPNTVSGFGITDVYTKSEVNTAISEATPTFETILEKPNTISGYGITDAYTITQTNQAIANVVNSAPTTLDTLNELAAALGNDANFSTTVATNIGNVTSNLSSHTSSTSNPHSVTASQVGLGNVNNTSDANKPVSTATQTALNLKADSSTLSSHTGNTSNPHSVTKAQVGLTNVEDKSSATIRGEITSGNVTTALGYTPQNSSTAITTSNIGSQSVNYATTAGNGGVTSVNGLTGAVTLSSGGVTSLNGQTGAIVNTNIDAIGSIVKAAYMVRLGTPPVDDGAYYFLNAGTAVAGSNLRYNPSVIINSTFNYLDLYWDGSSYSGTWSNYGGGGTSLSGTWRCLGRIAQYVTRSSEGWYYWSTTGCYFVRVS